MGLDTLRSYKEGLGAKFALLLLMIASSLLIFPRLYKEIRMEEKEEFFRIARPPPGGECDVLLPSLK